MQAFVGYREGEKYVYKWRCQCDCGAYKVVLTGHLRSGATKSCGCAKLKRQGLTTHPLWSTWENMRRRCFDPSDKHYANYGGRGITVDHRWLDVANFIADMGEKPVGHTLERVDNNGPYSKENCVWADRTTQASNKRNVPLFEHSGERLSIAQWARRFGIPAETLRSRVKRGVPLPDALTLAK